MSKAEEKTRLEGIQTIGKNASDTKKSPNKLPMAASLAHEITADNLFPVRPLLKMENYDKLLSEKSYYHYHYDWNKILYKTDAFSIIKCTHTPTSTPRIAKIYEKKVLDDNPKIYEDIKREIVLLDNLQHSEFVLKMEAAFETTVYIYMIYEHAVGISPTFYEDLSSTVDLKYLFFCAIAGLSEINSVNCSVVSFDHRNIVQVTSGEQKSYKIFNFWNLSEHKQKFKRDWKALDIHVDPKCIKNKYSCPSTDSWSVGVLLAQAIAFINLGENASVVDKKWIKDIKKQKNLPPNEQEILQYLLEQSTKKRVKVTELLTNHYFLSILKYKKDLGNKLFKSYQLDEYLAKDLIEELNERITKYERKSQIDAKNYLEKLKQSQIEQDEDSAFTRKTGDGEDTSSPKKFRNGMLMTPGSEKPTGRAKFKPVNQYKAKNQKQKKRGFFSRLFGSTLCCTDNRNEDDVQAEQNALKKNL